MDVGDTLGVSTPESNALDGLSMMNLKMRLAVVTRVIKDAQACGDPRWENVVPQQRRLNAALVKKIKEARRGRGEPDVAPVIVRMRPLSLSVKAETLGP